MTPVSGIVFSRDRAMQLDATLRSFYMHCQDPAALTLSVLYKTTNRRHAQQYAQLAQAYTAQGNVHFIEETDFRQQLLDLVATAQARGQGGYVMFLVDDNLFVRAFHVGEIGQALAQQPTAVGFLLRLGENITAMYAFPGPQVLPPLTRLSEHIRLFDWTRAQGDFNYPLEVSSSVFRSDEIGRLLQELAFANPNTLELELYKNQRRLRGQTPHLLCYGQSVTFCNPVNKVQTVFGNRAGTRPEYAATHLADMFDQGYRIQIEAYHGFVPHSVQQEVELVFEQGKICAAQGVLSIDTPLKLRAYPLCNQAVALAPPPAERTWDAASSALATAGAGQSAGKNGLELLCPYAVEVTWNGGPNATDIEIRLEAPAGAAPAFVQSKLGGGVLTFYPGYQFKTEADQWLWVRGPVNLPKDGLSPLESIVDTALLPCIVAVDWQITRPQQTIRFAAGEPFGALLPYPKASLENVKVEVIPLGK